MVTELRELGWDSRFISAFEDVENGDSKLSDFSIDDLQHCFSCEGKLMKFAYNRLIWRKIG